MPAWMRGAVFALVLTLFPACVFAQPFRVTSFTPWQGYALPNGSFLIGDFRGDGRTDILHIVNKADYVNLWLSNGDGTFSVQPFRPWPGYALPNGVLLAGDVAGNHRTSIVHAVANADYANIWLSNGTGSFTIKQWRPWQGYAMSNGPMLMGDFNGDGRADVFHAVQNTDYANIWLSNGDGTFTVKQFSPWTGYALPNGTLLAASVSGSGRTDIVHVVANTDYVNVWLSNGDGTFNVKSFRPWPGYNMNDGFWLTGDFNGDGKVDLMHVLNGYVNVWLSNGDGTFKVTSFTPWPGYALPNGVVLAADLNGDGTFTVSSFSPWNGYAIPNGDWLAADVTGDHKTDVIHMVNDTDYANVWLSGLPAPNQVAVQAMEVVQAIQDVAQDVNLVAQKQSWVRAYVGVASSQTLNGVAGTLQARNSQGQVVATISSVNTIGVPPIAGFDLHGVRDDWTKSLNFLLPANLTQASTETFTVTQLGAPRALSCSNCGTAAAKTGNFQTAPPLRVRIVSLQYSANGPNGTTQTFTPTSTDTSLLQSWLSRAYPVASVSASLTTVTANVAWPFTCNQANAQLSTLRATEVGNGTVDSRTHYIGLVSNGAGYMRGCAAGIPSGPDPTTVASAPTGPTSGNNVPVNVTGDTDGSFGDWYGGHELSHTFGRAHPGFCNGNSKDDLNFPYPNGQLSDNAGTYVGLDVGDSGNSEPRILLPGESRFDIMTYCNQPQWLSAYTYNAVLSRLIGEDPSLSGPAPRLEVAAGKPLDKPAPAPTLNARPPMVTALGAPLGPVVSAAPRDVAPVQELAGAPQVKAELIAPPPVLRGERPAAAGAQQPPAERPLVALVREQALSIVATLNLTRGTGRIESVRHVPAAMMETSTPQSDASIRLLDRAGHVLNDQPERVREDTDVPPNEDKTALISATLPDLSNVGAVQLVLSGHVVDSITVPATPPSAPAVQVSRSGATLAVRWNQPRAEGGRTTYDVQVSHDAGRTWKTVAVGLSSTSATLTPEQLGPGAPSQVRVIANDGFNTSPPGLASISP